MKYYKSVKLPILLFACLFSLNPVQSMEEVTKKMSKVSLSDKSGDRDKRIALISQKFKFDLTLFSECFRLVDLCQDESSKQVVVSRIMQGGYYTDDQRYSAFVQALRTRKELISKLIIKTFISSNLDSDFYFHDHEFSYKNINGQSAMVSTEKKAIFKPIVYILQTFNHTNDDDFKLIQSLLDKGADPNSLNIVEDFPQRGYLLKGLTPVMTLVFLEATRRVPKSTIKKLFQLFVKYKVVFNEQLSSQSSHLKGYTALHLSLAFFGNQVFDLLVKNKNCDLNIVADNGFTPLILSLYVSTDRYLDFEKLVKSARVNKNIVVKLTDRKIGKTNALNYAIYYCDLRAVQLLINKGAFIDSQLYDKNVYPALALATIRCFKDKANALLKAGADVNERIKSIEEESFFGWSALHIAIKKGDKELIDLLLKHPDIDVNLTITGDPNSILIFDKKNHLFGCTPIFLACSINDIQLVKRLLSMGADVNGKGVPTQFTPLHLAVGSRRNLALVKLLISYGAQVNVQAGASAYIDICFEHKKRNDTESDIDLAKVKDNFVNKVYGATPLSIAWRGSNLKIRVEGCNEKFMVDPKEISQMRTIINYLLSKGAILAKEEYRHLIKQKKSMTIFQKLLRGCKDIDLLNDLLSYASSIKNQKAVNVINQKINQVQRKNNQMQASPVQKTRGQQQGRGKRKNNKKGRRRKKSNKQNTSFQQQSNNQDAQQEISVKDYKAISKAFEDFVYDPITKQIIVMPCENIKVLADNDKMAMLIYNDLVNFGGKRLTMVVDKTNREFQGLGDVSHFGYDLSRRVTNGSRRDPKHSRNVQNGGWVENEQILKNPKMNNPHDPTHAFPQYIEKNFAQYCTNLYKTTDFNKFDKIDAKQAGRKLSDFAVKMYFEIPGKLLVEGTTQAGHFEYVILVPNGKVTHDNRPLCVHRFFRPSK